jgi:aspartokinase/homoserine dehydrogenase 1
MKTSPTHVLKFGGSSLQTTDLIRQAAELVSARTNNTRPVVVVSAINGVTDQLIALADGNFENTDSPPPQITQLKQQHLEYFDTLISADHPNRRQLNDVFTELEAITKDGIFCKNNRYAWKDQLLSIGERASAIIFASLLSHWDIPAHAREAQHFVKTDSSFGRAQVDLDTTRNLIQQAVSSADGIPVITGFIGSNDDKQITTLGRSGSDYTAGLVASALDARKLEIWTDVNGVLTADPKWVPGAESIQQLSFADISELSAHGANVIHPQTIRPLQNTDTSVVVKNSHNPVHPGTLITKDFNTNGALKTITITGPFVRLQVEQAYAQPLIQKLRSWLPTNPFESAVSFTQQSAFEPARLLLEQSFFDQVADQLARWAAENNVVLDLQDDLYKVKKFSNHFTQNESLTNRIWNLLDANDLQPVESHRNRDERFISFLFNRDDAQRSAQLLNNYLGDKDTIIDLFVAGTGEVGETLLEKLTFAAPKGIQFRLLGVCNSRYTLWDDQGLNLKKELDWSEAQATNWNSLQHKLTAANRHNIIFVDATGDEQVARLYADLLQHNIHIVTPSKLANTFEQSYFDKLQGLTKKGNTSFRYETTVGAGLPIISTITNLQQSGDNIHEISGVVSGTMTYLFNELENGTAFSKAIIDARKKGYAEPDPRDDLSGEDVARKFLTLARTISLTIEREELEVESLIPAELRNVNKQTFLERLSDYDQEWAQRIKEAKENNRTLRYTGRLADGKITIGIDSVAIDSPLGQLKGTDNLIQVYSSYYNNTPLVIQGAGAGKEVTAGGVLSDILKTAESISH